MLIQIEAQDIDELLAEDECLVPSVEDLLLDALIEYRDTQRLTSKHDDLNVKITISLVHPSQFARGHNGKGERT